MSIELNITAGNFTSAMIKMTAQDLIVCKALVFKKTEVSKTNQEFVDYATALGMVHKTEFKRCVEMSPSPVMNQPLTQGLEWFIIGQGKAQGRFGHHSLNFFKAMMMTDIIDPDTEEVLKKGYQFVGTVPGVRGKSLNEARMMACAIIKQDKRDTKRLNELVSQVKEEVSSKQFIKDVMLGHLADIEKLSNDGVDFSESLAKLHHLIKTEID